MRSMRGYDISRKYCDCTKFYVRYLTTTQGPDYNKKKYSTKSLDDICLWKFSSKNRTNYGARLFLAYQIQNNEPLIYWPYYLINMTLKKQTPPRLSELCYSGKDITKHPGVVEHNKKFPLPTLPDYISFQRQDPPMDTMGTSTFLENVLNEYPHQQESMFTQQSTEFVEPSSATGMLFQNEADMLSNSTAYPGINTAFRDSISPILASERSPLSALDLVSSSDEVDEAENETRGDALPEWLCKPRNFPEKDNIWQQLYNFGFKYREDIAQLINCDDHTKTATTATGTTTFIYSDDFQIVTPERHTWSLSELREAVSEMMKIVGKSL
uniref:Uncharacterized protein n=1 Tax=Tetranychus urticae TaxID=32264 RepID=T1KUD7_TETUR